MKAFLSSKNDIQGADHICEPAHSVVSAIFEERQS